MNYDSNPTQPNPTMKEILSAREFEVLELIAHGCKDREIALALGIQDATVRFHVKNIVKKLGAKNRTMRLASQFKMAGNGMNAKN